MVKYVTVDVFNDIKFSGNQLAVFPDASTIPSELMLKIAKEFNYSETTFVLPPTDPKHAARVRIFTVFKELPFAGHPLVGTTFTLVKLGLIKLTGDETHIVLEVGVGPIPITIFSKGGNIDFVQLTAAKLPEFGQPVPKVEDIATMLCISREDILNDGILFPEVLSVGLPFLFVPVRNKEVLKNSRIGKFNNEGFDFLGVFVFTMLDASEEHQVRARMFEATIGEDPATGSACVTFGGYLGSRSSQENGTLKWTVEQGYEMGRPSLLFVEADKKDGKITALRVGGKSVLVCVGDMEFL
eukprot:TRINITY_DN830_c0_g1_i2.p1 TRINITY_DN830_c0_g1~~TRINITY_DN830_c0_g1_i2.p1  ORF type:complete len:298 (-),score=57.63 TRINITY_DN830_c0_g1_i2:192-1085(-)